MGTHASRPVEEEASCGVLEACLSVPPSPSHSHYGASPDEDAARCPAHEAAAAGIGQPQPASAQILFLPNHVLTHHILPRVSSSQSCCAFLATCKAAHCLDSVFLQADWLEQNRLDTALPRAAGPCGSEALFLQLLDRPNVVAVSALMHPDSAHLLRCASEAGYAQAVRRLLLLPGMDVNAAEIVVEGAESVGEGAESMEEGAESVEEGAESVDGGRLGCTALHCAAERGHAEIVCLLLQAGADVNAQLMGGTTSMGCTALHFAAQQGHAEVVRLLLHAGADVNVQSEGRSPLSGF